MTLTTATGEVSIACHLVIARLGSTPPRARLERMGLSFSSPLPTALPDLDKALSGQCPRYLCGWRAVWLSVELNRR